MRVLITGVAGYVGSVLIDALQAMNNVTRIVGVDLRPRPDRLAGNGKVAWIQADVSTDDWQAAARELAPMPSSIWFFRSASCTGPGRKSTARL
jgi:nucleoside-diphosphate-sugar epimerase